MEIEGTVTNKRRRRRLDYLMNHTFRVSDPFEAMFYTRFSFRVPLPRNAQDKPCILVGINNAVKGLFLRFADVDSLLAVFSLPQDYAEELQKALDNAHRARAIREALDKEVLKQLEADTLKTSFPLSQA